MPGIVLVILLCLVNFVMMRHNKGIMVEETPESNVAEPVAIPFGPRRSS